MMANAKGRLGSLVLALCATLCLACCGQAATEEQAKTRDEEPAVAQVAASEPSVASQGIGLEGVGNARQLGGYVGEGGRVVKDGVLLRAAALGGATEEDVARLTDDYNLSIVLDFRMSQEIEASPDLQIEGVRNEWLGIMDEEALAKKMQGLDPEDAAKLQSNNLADKFGVLKEVGVVGDQMYIEYLSSEVGKQGYAKMFQELLALPEGEALLFHCTQGKDRTGCAAMLILSALGVDEQTILADYMLTNDFNAERIEHERQQLIDAGVADDDLNGIMIGMDQVFPQTMTNAMDWIEQHYGSAQGYISQELGVSEGQIAALQDKFLA